MREAGRRAHVLGDVTADPRRRSATTPDRVHRCRATSWAAPAWATIPRTSVFDRWQRLHEMENVVCTDSSVFPTSTGYGPTLTIVALAIRASRALAGLDPLRSSSPRPGTLRPT